MHSVEPIPTTGTHQLVFSVLKAPWSTQAWAGAIVGNSAHVRHCVYLKLTYLFASKVNVYYSVILISVGWSVSTMLGALHAAARLRS